MTTTILAQFKMSAQADWNHLVVDLRNNIFKLVFFAFDCSKSAADDVLPAASENAETSRGSDSSNGSDSSDVGRRRGGGGAKKKKKKTTATLLRKKVKRVPSPLPPPSPPRRSSPPSAGRPTLKRKKSAAPSTLFPVVEDAASAVRHVEDVNFQNVLY
jgi:hypothetical protein